MTKVYPILDGLELMEDRHKEKEKVKKNVIDMIYDMIKKNVIDIIYDMIKNVKKDRKK